MEFACSCIFFFFFQAEDGIRDLYVTGVQTCALPIFGCGTGQSRQIYADRTAGYVGLDLSFGALAVARREFSAMDWGQADACRLPFANSTFDVVAFSSVLHHIPDFRPALQEAWRILMPGVRVFA